MARRPAADSPLVTEAMRIDEHDMPGWCDRYMSNHQAVELTDRTRWAIVLDNVKVSAHAKLIGYRLCIWATNTERESWRSIKTMAAAVSLSQNTVRDALLELCAAGMLHGTRRMLPNGQGAPTIYALAWPADEWVATSPITPPGPVCGAKKKHGGICLRRAGWGVKGTTEGHCKDHQTPHPMKGGTSSGEGPGGSSDAGTPLHAMRPNEVLSAVGVDVDVNARRRRLPEFGSLQ